MSERLGQTGRETLARERAARKAAEREAAALRKYKRKSYEMRDKAELWEGRAIRYSNKLKQVSSRQSALVTHLQQMRDRVGETAAAKVLAGDLDHALNLATAEHQNANA